jgi:hypothetical protein
MKDLTRNAEKSVSFQIEPLVININKYDFQGLKFEVKKILHDPNTCISKHKLSYYLLQLDSFAEYELNSLRNFIKNIYLSGANLSTKEFYKP